MPLKLSTKFSIDLQAVTGYLLNLVEVSTGTDVLSFTGTSLILFMYQYDTGKCIFGRYTSSLRYRTYTYMEHCIEYIGILIQKLNLKKSVDVGASDRSTIRQLVATASGTHGTQHVGRCAERCHQHQAHRPSGHTRKEGAVGLRARVGLQAAGQREEKAIIL